eukprot:COSAG01_NODE_608_length_14865_cov_5.517879_14_plen_75_part_00
MNQVVSLEVVPVAHYQPCAPADVSSHQGSPKAHASSLCDEARSSAQHIVSVAAAAQQRSISLRAVPARTHNGRQ